MKKSVFKTIATVGAQLIVSVLLLTQPVLAQKGSLEKVQKWESKGLTDKTQNYLANLLEGDRNDSIVYHYLTEYINRPAKVVLTDQIAAYKKLEYTDSLRQLLDAKSSKSLVKWGLNQPFTEQVTRAVTNRVANNSYLESYIDSIELVLFSIPNFPQKVLLTQRRDSLAYSEARKEHSVQAYRNFLTNYPKASQFRAAKKHYDALLFATKTKTESIDDYAQFIENHPNSPFLGSAYEKLYNLWVQDGRLASFQSFLTEYPEAPQKLNALRWVKLLASDRYSTLDSFHIPLVTNEGLVVFDITNGSSRLVYDSSQCVGDVEDHVVLQNATGYPDIPSIRPNSLTEQIARGSTYIKTIKGGLSLFKKEEGYYLANLLTGESGDKYYQSITAFREAQFIGGTSTGFNMYSFFGRSFFEEDYDSIYQLKNTLILQKDSTLFLADPDFTIKAEITSIEEADQEHIYVRKDSTAAVWNLINSQFDVEPGVYDVFKSERNWLLYNDSSVVLTYKEGDSIRSASFKEIYQGTNFYIGDLDSQFVLLNPQLDTILTFDTLLSNGDEFFHFVEDGQEFWWISNKIIPVGEKESLLTGSKTYYIQRQQGRSKYEIKNLSNETLFISSTRVEKVLDDSLFLIRKRNYTLVNAIGQAVLDEYYQSIYASDEGIVLYNGSRFGLYDAGKELPSVSLSIPLKYSDSIGHIIETESGYGLLGINNTLFLDPRYKSILPWTDTLAIVEKEEGYQFLYIKSQAPASGLYEAIELNELPNDLIARTLTASGLGLWSARYGALLPNEYTDILVRTVHNQIYYTALRTDPITEYSIALTLDATGKLLTHDYLNPEVTELYYCDE